MENKKSGGEAISSAQAVFLGALAPGVNVRTISLSHIYIYIYDPSTDDGLFC